MPVSTALMSVCVCATIGASAALRALLSTSRQPSTCAVFILSNSAFQPRNLRRSCRTRRALPPTSSQYACLSHARPCVCTMRTASKTLT